MDISAAARVEGWEKFLAGERAALVERANGRLACALRTALPGESREELDRLIEEDRRLARAGLVSLVAEDGTVSHKHVDELKPEEMPARHRAETARLDWLISVPVRQALGGYGVPGGEGDPAARERRPQRRERVVRDAVVALARIHRREPWRQYRLRAQSNRSVQGGRRGHAPVAVGARCSDDPRPYAREHEVRAPGGRE